MAMFASAPLTTIALGLLLVGCQREDPFNVPSSSALQASVYGPSTAADGGSALDLDKLSLESVVLAAFTGHDATPLPDQKDVLNGADLGWAFSHRDKLWVMFGDSWWHDSLNLAGRPDDALGQISLTDFPDGASVDAYVRAHPAAAGAPAWHAAAPPLHVVRTPDRGFAPVISEQNGRQLRSGIGAVPVAAFSNGRDDAAEGVFALFAYGDPIACSNGTCPDGYACDAQLGLSSVGALTPPCVLGSSPTCVAGMGLCQDRTINRYDASTAWGRTTTVLNQLAVGVTTPSEPTHFETQPWHTLRFLNPTARTVSDFDATRAYGAGNDYTPAHGNQQSRSGVFVWGRSHFAGLKSEGRDLRLYVAWLPMPVPDADKHFEWQPQYFTGLDAAGLPQFSNNELEARELDLNAEVPGEQPEEPHDLVGQMSVTWLPGLKQFLMFYGGDVPGFTEGLVAWDDPSKIQRNPLGSLWVRFAPQPWGPWTQPRMLLEAGDRSTDATPSMQYASGGILAHNRCRDSSCARYDPAYLLDIGGNNNGVLYAPSIIDAWTTEASDQSASLYWLLSTWNPYQVVLMKTVLRP